MDTFGLFQFDFAGSCPTCIVNKEGTIYIIDIWTSDATPLSFNVLSGVQKKTRTPEK